MRTLMLMISAPHSLTANGSWLVRPAARCWIKSWYHL